MEITADLEKELEPIIDRLAEKKFEEYTKQIDKRFTPGNDPDSPGETEGFKSFGEQLMAVKNFETRHELNPLLKQTGLSEGQPSEGGFLVQTDFATQLLEKVYTSSDIIARVTRLPVSANSNAMKIPAVGESSRADGSRWGGIRAYWAAEAGTKTPSQPAFDQVSLELKKLIGLCYATDELLNDAPALEAWVRMAFTKEFDFKIADAIINGDGAGKPLGILNAPCTYAITAETGQATTTILAENIIKMWAARYGPNSSNYVWLINQNIEPQLFTMSLAVGTGGIPVYMPAGGLSVAPYATLIGRPVIPCEQCATLGTAGDIILADLSQYIMIDKGTTEAASSIHVKFTTDETAFRFVFRCDGQPWWKTYLTPYKGSTSYQSPFVTIATRS